jgi:hypothetical protein
LSLLRAKLKRMLECQLSVWMNTECALTNI